MMPHEVLNQYVLSEAVSGVIGDLNEMRRAVVNREQTDPMLYAAVDYKATLRERIDELMHLLAQAHDAPLTEEQIPTWAQNAVSVKVERIIANMVADALSKGDAKGVAETAKEGA